MGIARRRLLAGTSAVIALAGCLGSDDDADAGDIEETDDGDDGADGDSDDGMGDETDDDGSPTYDDADANVVVAPDGDHRFEPETVEIETYDEVAFHWEGDGHNVVVRSQPDGGSWDGNSDSRDAGHTYLAGVGFGEEGVYEYVCEHHEDDGMAGRIEVS